MIEYKTTSNQKEVEEIIQLQQNNLFENVSEEERNQEGFVTVQHSFDQLQSWHETKPHTIAVSNGQVVGYAISMLRKYREEVPVLVPMFEKIDAKIEPHLKYIVMGQICIHKDFRGKGIFRGLYKKMVAFCSDFDWIITEVDTNNQRSMNAHKAIGFEELISYESQNRTWSLIYLDLSKR